MDGKKNPVENLEVQSTVLDTHGSVACPSPRIEHTKPPTLKTLLCMQTCVCVNQ